jgi:hypothetical protein
VNILRDKVKKRQCECWCVCKCVKKTIEAAEKLLEISIIS